MRTENKSADPNKWHLYCCPTDTLDKKEIYVVEYGGTLDFAIDEYGKHILEPVYKWFPPQKVWHSGNTQLVRV